jgi:hypothetical protein
METLFNVQPILPSKNKIVPDLSEHDCIYLKRISSDNLFQKTGNFIFCNSILKNGIIRVDLAHESQV